MLLTDVNTLRIYKDITGLAITSVGAGRKETAEALRTNFLESFVELKRWYGGTIFTFTTSDDQT